MQDGIYSFYDSKRVGGPKLEINNLDARIILSINPQFQKIFRVLYYTTRRKKWNIMIPL